MIRVLDKKEDRLGRVRVEITDGGENKKRVTFAKPIGGLLANSVTGFFDRVLIGVPVRSRVFVDGVEHFEEVHRTYLVPTTIPVAAQAVLRAA